MKGVPVKTYLECVPCIIKQAISTLRISGCSDKTGRKVIAEVIKRLKNIDYDLSPAANSEIAYVAFREITGIKDPYNDLKRKYNRLALNVYPELEKLVNASKDRLYMAAKAAIAGNIIDFGIDIKKAITLDLKNIIRDLPQMNLAVDDYGKFKELLKHSINILYISDNAGEMVFDKVFIKELVRLDKKVVLTVKSDPIINDATMEDAAEVNFNGLARVIGTGNNNIGINLDNSSDVFLEEFKKADLIVAKGQGNFETLDGVSADIFFLLKAKCESIARELGVRHLDIVFAEGRSRVGNKDQ
jgi:uncharacterized protein with ATP-grasp and redox domains